MKMTATIKHEVSFEVDDEIYLFLDKNPPDFFTSSHQEWSDYDKKKEALINSLIEKIKKDFNITDYDIYYISTKNQDYSI